MTPAPFNPRGDAAIIGAGCAGVSLAVRLLEAFPSLSITIYESRPRIERDRTWCSWRFGRAFFPEAVTASWSKWIVASPNRRLTVHSPDNPYDHVPSDAFYDLLLPRLDAEARCRIHYDEPTTAVEPREDDNAVLLRTTRRETSHDFAFDARPPEKSGLALTSEPFLEQHFAGREIETDADAFDPELPTLMDFNVDQSEGLHFFYVLPFSPRRALLEATWMTPRNAPRPDYDARIADYARNVFNIDSFRTIRAERAMIPMTTARPPRAPHPRIWPIGSRAGMTRPSTGYTFDAIQRDAERVIHALRTGAPRPAPPRTRLMHTLDRVLLSLLQRRPDLGPDIFARLFEHAPTPALVRFLNDRATHADTLRVAWAMPKAPVVGHILRHPRAALL